VNPPLDIQGHRGARGLLPENTLPAFARALAIGVTTLELDCAITRDGVVVVSHDSTLNPEITRDDSDTSDEGGGWITRDDLAINQFSFDELQRFDVGRINPACAYAKRFPRQQAVDGARMPRLDEVFALARWAGDNRVRFNIETKISPLQPGRTVAPEAFAEALIYVIKNNGLRQRVTIQSFDWRTLVAVQRIAPGVCTACLTAQQPFMDNIRAHDTSSPWNAGLHVSQFDGSVPRMVKAAGGAFWSPCSNDVTAASIHEAHALGLKVVTWTVNTEAEMRRMIELGVDGIISDYPDVLRRVAGDCGFALPAPALVETSP
jgi:glycerophosphoryl diester phosphodiesterase